MIGEFKQKLYALAGMSGRVRSNGPSIKQQRLDRGFELAIEATVKAFPQLQNEVGKNKL